MGEELRNLAIRGGELGNRVKDIMHKGELVDDQTVAQVIQQAIKNLSNPDNFVMEGYPRSISQIKIFDPIFDKVFYLKITEDEQIKRIMGRGRSDDTPEAIKKRIEVQKQGLMDVLDYYREKNEVLELDGTKSIKEIYETIRSYIRKGLAH